MFAFALDLFVPLRLFKTDKRTDLDIAYCAQGSYLLESLFHGHITTFYFCKNYIACGLILDQCCDVCLQAIEAEVNVFYPELTEHDSSLNLLANQLRRLQVSKSSPSGAGQGRG